MLVLVPLGPLAGMDQRAWRRFIEGRGAVRGLTLGRAVDGGRVLHGSSLETLQWLPGSVSRIYDLDAEAPNYVTKVSIADHLGQTLDLHPALSVHPDRVETRIEGVAALDIRSAREHWYGIGVTHNLLSDIMEALIRKFVRRIVLEDPEGLARIEGRPVLYLANHQTATESLTFCTLMVGLAKHPCRALTTRKQQHGIIGALTRMAESIFGKSLALGLLVFSAEERESLFPVLEEYRKILTMERASLYVAVEGQRAHRADHPVRRLSSTFIDLAVENDLPIVPVKFVGGLPQEAVRERLDFPYHHGKQDYYLGRAIWPSTLHGLAYAERPRHVMERINEMGPEAHLEMPLPPDRGFSARVAALERGGVPGMVALLIESLRDLEEPSDETRAFLENTSILENRIPESSNPLIQLISALMSSPPESRSSGSSAGAGEF
jgi:1-acyl-sn-glycerol-3-phosphate acyltransferase